MKKLPPIEKIYEAYTAIADQRIALVDGDSFRAPKGVARMSSSDGTKNYVVTWQDNEYSSTDSGTWWQGYPGYPVIALLMLQGKIPCEESVAAGFKNVDWTSLNRQHKRDYKAAVEEIIESRSLDAEACQMAVSEAYSALERLPVVIVRRRPSTAPETAGKDNQHGENFKSANQHQG